jgi:hypothetical protein
MPVTLNSNQINFTNNILYDGDFLAIRKVYSQVDWGICYANTLSWGAGIANGGGARATGTMFVTRGIYKTAGALDAYGAPINGVNYPTNGSITTGYDTISYTNSSLTRSVRILIYAGAANPVSAVLNQSSASNPIGASSPLANAGRGTDDNNYTTVFRGGSPSSATVHSGGTALCTLKLGNFVGYETIAPNTTTTYWHYSNISGSAGDFHATRFYAEFLNFV